jgi:hypothetical protein
LDIKTKEPDTLLVKAILFRSVALASAAAAVVLISRYPLGWGVPAAVLAVYAVVLWRHPHGWLYVVLGLLPILNLYPWTGWLFVEEFDLVVLVTLAIGYLRAGTSRPHHRFTPLGAIAVLLLTLSYLASALLPLRGAPAFSWEALATYNTPLNSLRVLKGWAWPLLLLPLLRRAADHYGNAFLPVVARGMLGGLAVVSLVVLWERNAFPGLMNFSADYRAIGPFFEAHVGGAALDGYLALTLPFALVLLLQARSLKTLRRRRRSWCSASTRALLPSPAASTSALRSRSPSLRLLRFCNVEPATSNRYPACQPLRSASLCS